jgi:hypothetical protein
VFGYGEYVEPNGAGKAVGPERIDGSWPKTIIVKKTVEDQRAVTHDHLGQVKNCG